MIDGNVILALIGLAGIIFGGWKTVSQNRSEAAKIVAIKEAEIRANSQAAQEKERADMLAMIGQLTHQGQLFLDSLKENEKAREQNYATLKNIIEDGTATSVTEMQNTQGRILDTSKTQHEAVLATLDRLATTLTQEIQKVIASVDKLPSKHDDEMRRLDMILGYIENLRPKLRTGEVPVTALPTATPTTP